MENEIQNGNVSDTFSILIQKFNEILFSTPAELLIRILIALLAAMIAVQVAKGIVKTIWEVKTARQKKIRRTFFLLLSYVGGYQFSEYFLVDPGKISVFLGLVNPVVYILLCRWAFATDRILLLAILKSRKLERDQDGKLKLGEVQPFFIGLDND